LFNPFGYLSGSPPVAFARTDNSGRPIPRRHPLTLIVFVYRQPIDGCRIYRQPIDGCRVATAAAMAACKQRRVVCACTLYLVFKEPARPGVSPPDPSVRPGRRRLSFVPGALPRPKRSRYWTFADRV